MEEELSIVLLNNFPDSSWMVSIMLAGFAEIGYERPRIFATTGKAKRTKSKNHTPMSACRI